MSLRWYYHVIGVMSQFWRDAQHTHTLDYTTTNVHPLYPKRWCRSIYTALIWLSLQLCVYRLNVPMLFHSDHVISGNSLDAIQRALNRHKDVTTDFKQKRDRISGDRAGTRAPYDKWNYHLVLPFISVNGVNTAYGSAMLNVFTYFHLKLVSVQKMSHEHSIRDCKIESIEAHQNRILSENKKFVECQNTWNGLWRHHIHCSKLNSAKMPQRFSSSILNAHSPDLRRRSTRTHFN